jgi:hypothetical protein
MACSSSAATSRRLPIQGVPDISLTRSSAKGSQALPFRNSLGDERSQTPLSSPPSGEGASFRVVRVGEDLVEFPGRSTTIAGVTRVTNIGRGECCSNFISAFHCAAGRGPCSFVGGFRNPVERLSELKIDAMAEIPLLPIRMGLWDLQIL